MSSQALEDAMCLRAIFELGLHSVRMCASFLSPIAHRAEKGQLHSPHAVVRMTESASTCKGIWGFVRNVHCIMIC